MPKTRRPASKGASGAAASEARYERGHLPSFGLGGQSNAANMFPISSEANQSFSPFEQMVAENVSSSGQDYQIQYAAPGWDAELTAGEDTGKP